MCAKTTSYTELEPHLAATSLIGPPHYSVHSYSRSQIQLSYTYYLINKATLLGTKCLVPKVALLMRLHCINLTYLLASYINETLHLIDWYYGVKQPVNRSMCSL